MRILRHAGNFLIVIVYTVVKNYTLTEQNFYYFLTVKTAIHFGTM